MPPQTDRSSSTARTYPKKSTLFCPNCGYDSPVDGGWRVQAHADRVVYDCPVCDDTITERPTRAETSPVSSMSRDSSAGDSILARSVRLAFAWTAWPYTPGECALE
jgi:predicted RNA-binding Zn-ribbon protein involved in translation (DUF1610 family)